MTNDNRLSIWGYRPLRSAVFRSVTTLGLLAACGPTAEVESAVAPREESAVSQGALSSTTVSEEISVSAPSSSSATQRSPAVALGGGNYLVAWSETGTANSSDRDVLAVRVRASDGAVLDAQPLVIATGSAIQTSPAIGFDGTNFLVVWTELGQVGAPAIHGVRVSGATGALLGSPRLISNVNNPQSVPQDNAAVSFDGTNFLVVWKGWHFWGGMASEGVLGAWVWPSTGELVQPYSFVLARYTSSPPRVTYGAGRHLVVWSNHENGSANVYGMRIEGGSRTILDTAPRAIAAAAVTEDGPSVAQMGGQFLVVWSNASGGIEGTRVLYSGEVMSPRVTVSQTGVTRSSVVFDGSHYQVAWQETRDGVRKLFSRPVSTSSEVGAELLLSEVESSSETSVPGIAAEGPGKFLVAYSRADLVKARLMGAPPPPACVATEPGLEMYGEAVMVFECQPGATYSDPGAYAWDSCGQPLEVHAYNTGKDSSGPGPRLGAVGSYNVSYAAWDSQGWTGNAVRTVKVVDTQPPALALKGPDRMTHTCGSMWNDPGVEAYDVCYGDLKHTVRKTGEVNGWAEGVYTVRYSLTDSNGNSAEPLSRTVEVVDCPW